MKNEPDRTRRTFMKKAAATAGAFGVGAGAANAAPTDGAVTELDAAPAAVEAVLGEHGQDLLADLDEEDVLSAGAVGELPTDQRLSFADVADKREGTAVLQWDDRPDEVRSISHVDGGVLEVAVEPDNDRSYAIFHPDGADEVQVYANGTLCTAAACDPYCGSWDCLGITCEGACTRECCYRCPCSSDCSYSYECNCTC